jgi:protein SCO1/2
MTSRRCFASAMNRRTFVLSVATAALALGGGGCVKSPASFKATDITGAKFANDFALTGPDGTPRSLADFRGKVVVVFFGYVQCPDVCPTTLSTLRTVREQLGVDGDRLQVVFITVDPERDTREVLSQYVPAFDPSFIGLSGDAAATERVAREFRVLYSKNAGKTPTSYTVDHSAGVFIFDPQGRIRLYASQNMTPDDYVHDIKALLAH